jgi:hypothetical protein
VFDHAEVYQLTSAGPNPQRVADIELNRLNAFLYTMPAYSVSTLVLHSTGLPGDFDVDGDVDGNDFLVWQRNQSVGNLADWRAHFGVGGASPAADAVPEPSSLALALACAAAVAGAGRRRRNPSVRA